MENNDLENAKSKGSGELERGSGGEKYKRKYNGESS